MSRNMGQGGRWLSVPAGALAIFSARCEPPNRQFEAASEAGSDGDLPEVIGRALPEDGMGDGPGTASVGGEGEGPLTVGDGLDSPEGASASGEGELGARVDAVAFGPATLGFAVPATVLLENVGSGTLEPPVIAIEGSAPEHFAITQNECVAPLAPGGTCAVGLAFQPQLTGALQADLVIDGADSRLILPLSGEGLEPGELILEAALDGAVDFGDVPLGESRVQTFRVTNPGDVVTGALFFNLNDDSFALLDPAGDDCVPDATSLGAGQGCDLQVRFSPSARGRVEATLTALSADAGSVSLNLSGNGQAPALLEASHEVLDFGDVVIEAGATLELTLRNGGDLELPEVVATVAEGDAGEFSVTQNGCQQPLGSGLSCNVVLTFNPALPGPRSAGLELDAGAAGSRRAQLVGVGLEPGDLLVNAASGSSVNFGSVLLGESRDQTFVINNPGDVPTGALTLASNNPEFRLLTPTGSDCASGSTDLEGGASCSVRVRFAPTGRQQRNATLSVSSTGVGSSSLNLSGTGLSRAALQASGPIDFGRIPRDTSATRQVVVENAGDEPLGAVITQLTGTNAGDYRLANNGCGPGLGLGERCNLSLTFSPGTTGSRLATLRVTTNPGGSRDVRLEGVSLEPGSLRLAPQAGSAAAFNDALVVGSGQSQTQTYVLSNAGEVDSGAINVAVLTGGFQVLTPTGGDCRSNQTTLGGGASCTLRVRFSPAARGPAGATLSVSSAAAGSASLNLSGSGLAPAQLDVQANSLSYGNVTRGQSASQSVTVRNLVDVALGTPSVGFSGRNAGDFARAGGTCAGAVAAGASCTIAIAFSPGGSGGREATAQIQASPGGSDSLSLTGNGQAPGSLVLEAAAGATNFGSVVIGGSVSRTITLRNAGDLSAGRLIAINLGTGFSQQTGGGADCSTQTQLGGGSTCNVRVVFSPNAARRFDVTLSVTSQQGGTATLALTGTGFCPDGQEPQDGRCFISNGQECDDAGDCASGICLTRYPDVDDDDYGDDNAGGERLCGPLRDNESTNNLDCCDRDILANPDQTRFFDEPNGCFDFDYDCNGDPESSLASAAEVTMCAQRSPAECSGSFWSGVAPACGQTSGITICGTVRGSCSAVSGQAGVRNFCH